MALDPELRPLDLDPEFRRVKVEADKTAIGAALKKGREVEGCSLVERRSWSIK